ncbi:hypothetical protein RND59_00695 [Vibrio ruber]|uniref:hypothetical protein n=1 Tax=Vibrio ruber TaxID=184755 RepID=UPI002892BFB4|nr:hypothetical protein [Vibrio ruber]WNJ95675.1 hypothetical protein RND59_00695 [Vibrio ruber]
MITEKEIIVDGQRIALPSRHVWDSFVTNPIYKGVPVYTKNTKNLVLDLIQLIADYPDYFCLGLYRTSHVTKSWSVVPLLVRNEVWRRVQIEHISCLFCEWSGRIANPTEPSLYFSVSDEFAALQKAFSLDRLPCPKCGAELPRHAVWVESRMISKT